MRPPSTQMVYFQTKSGKHKGFFAKDINRFVRNINRWKDVDENKWYDDSEVISWEYIVR